MSDAGGYPPSLASIWLERPLRSPASIASLSSMQLGDLHRAPGPDLYLLFDTENGTQRRYKTSKAMFLCTSTYVRGRLADDPTRSSFALGKEYYHPQAIDHLMSWLSQNLHSTSPIPITVPQSFSIRLELYHLANRLGIKEVVDPMRVSIMTSIRESKFRKSDLEQIYTLLNYKDGLYTEIVDELALSWHLKRGVFNYNTIQEILRELAKYPSLYANVEGALKSLCRGLAASSYAAQPTYEEDSFGASARSPGSDSNTRRDAVCRDFLADTIAQHPTQNGHAAQATFGHIGSDHAPLQITNYASGAEDIFNTPQTTYRQPVAHGAQETSPRGTPAQKILHHRGGSVSRMPFAQESGYSGNGQSLASFDGLYSTLPPSVESTVPPRGPAYHSNGSPLGSTDPSLYRNRSQSKHAAFGTPRGSAGEQSFGADRRQRSGTSSNSSGSHGPRIPATPHRTHNGSPSEGAVSSSTTPGRYKLNGATPQRAFVGASNEPVTVSSPPRYDPMSQPFNPADRRAAWGSGPR